MAKLRGKDILILVKDASGVYIPAGCQRGATISRSADVIDVSCKGTEFREYLTGLATATISCDGVYVPDNAAHVLLLNAFNSKSIVKVRISESSVEVLEADAVITTFDIDAPYDAEATYSLELQITGNFTVLEVDPMTDEEVMAAVLTSLQGQGYTGDSTALAAAIAGATPTQQAAIQALVDANDVDGVVSYLLAEGIIVIA